MPDALVSAYDWTSSLEQQMMENVDSRSQKVFLKALFMKLIILFIWTHELREFPVTFKKTKMSLVCLHFTLVFANQDLGLMLVSSTYLVKIMHEN